MRIIGLAFVYSVLVVSAARPPTQPATPTAPAPPGVSVDIGGRKIHAIISGEGSPAVVLISGMGDFAVDWALVQPSIAQFTRTVAYDRAGDAWSDPSADDAGGMTFAGQADDLHALLAHARVSQPYVLVGHSWGGALGRVYTARYPAEVVGMVLIDSTHEDSLLWINGTVLRPRLASASEWASVWKPLPPGTKLSVHRRAPTALDAPYDKLPAESQKLRLWAMGKQTPQLVDFRTELQTLHELAATGNFPLGDRPLVVLTRSLPNTDEEKGWTVEQQEQDHKRLQIELAGLSRNSRQVVVEKSGHHIQLDRPAAVVDAVRQVVTAVREHKALSLTVREGK